MVRRRQIAATDMAAEGSVPTETMGLPVNKLSAGLLILCGASIAIAISYDASALTELLGLTRHGGEGVVALTGLVLSTVIIAVGTHGAIRQWMRGVSRAAA